VKARLEKGVVGQRQHEDAIRQLFADAGCHAEDQPIDKHTGNVICTLPGETSSAIIAGGHIDFIDRGEGMIDDWSGSSLLPSLYQALKTQSRKHTFILVAFSGEERGLIGSSDYVKRLTSQQKESIRAFINLECLGLAPPKVWTHRSTPELVGRLNEVAKAMNIGLQGVNVDRVGDDDTHPFLKANIPVISIHSVTQDTISILHTRRDRLDAIHFDDYYSTYKLIAYYLAYLDAKMDQLP
jgi:Zn-dependent M28 family amino/carboxypeptidase